MNKYVVEFIGSLFLMLTIGCVSMNANVGALAPLAIGCALMTMVYAGGHISGGHFNPAVTLSVCLRGKCAAMDVIPYWVAQIAGAIAAALLAQFFYRNAAVPEMVNVSDRTMAALAAEFLFTFALCYVVLNVATAAGTANNSFYGLAIGFTVLTGAYAVGAISGGAFNPAVAIGACLMKLFAWTHLWVYLVAELVGGAAAAAVFMLVTAGDADD